LGELLEAGQVHPLPFSLRDLFRELRVVAGRVRAPREVLVEGGFRHGHDAGEGPHKMFGLFGPPHRLNVALVFGTLAFFRGLFLRSFPSAFTGCRLLFQLFQHKVVRALGVPLVRIDDEIVVLLEAFPGEVLVVELGLVKRAFVVRQTLLHAVPGKLVVVVLAGMHDLLVDMAGENELHDGAVQDD